MKCHTPDVNGLPAVHRMSGITLPRDPLMLDVALACRLGPYTLPVIHPASHSWTGEAGSTPQGALRR